MCMIKVRPAVEEEEEVTLPARPVGHRRADSHGSRVQETTIIETVKAPPPPPSALSLHSNNYRDSATIIQAPEPPASIIGSEMVRHRRHYPHDSPRASVVSARSHDYYVDSSAYAARSPRSSYRYVDARGSGRVDGVGAGGGGGSARKELDYVRGDRYGYNNYHGRRSGSVSYVNPRHSTASHRSGRSMREKVVVVDEYGREKFY